MVKPLPDINRPADYNGAVGQFSIDAVLDKKNISAQDAAKLQVTIKGSGNLPVIDAPQVQWPANVDTFGTTSKEDIDKTVVPMKGSKTFEYVFTPKAAGSFNIPAINFSYFDPSSNSYKTSQSAALHIDVSAAKKQTSSSSKSILSGQQSDDMINNIKSFTIAHLEWIFAVIILSCVGIFLWIHNTTSLKKEEEKKQIAVLEIAKKEIEIPVIQNAVAIDPLARTKRLLEYGDYKGFYAELNRALWDALCNKLYLPASDLNKYNIGLQLKAKGWDDDAVYQLQDIFDKCEMNLYTPDYNSSDIEHTLQNAAYIIKYINEV